MNDVAIVFKQYISAVVVRNPFGLRYRDVHDHLFQKKTSENCFHVLSSQRVGNYITTQKIKLNNSQFYEARRKLNQDKKFIHLYTSLQAKSRTFSKVLHPSTCISCLPSVTSNDKSFIISFRVSCMHTITIGDENLLRFHECFDDKMIFKKDPLVEKFDLLIKLVVFCTNMERF